MTVQNPHILSLIRRKQRKVEHLLICFLYSHFIWNIVAHYFLSIDLYLEFIRFFNLFNLSFQKILSALFLIKLIASFSIIKPEWGVFSAFICLIQGLKQVEGKMDVHTESLWEHNTVNTLGTGNIFAVDDRLCVYVPSLGVRCLAEVHVCGVDERIRKMALGSSKPFCV